MTDDVVAELDAWPGDQMLHPDLVQRARDEIVALRKLTDGDWVWKQITDTRDAALEEAVQACTDQTSDDPPPGTYNDACEDCAAAIRVLMKNKSEPQS